MNIDRFPLLLKIKKRTDNEKLGDIIKGLDAADKKQVAREMRALRVCADAIVNFMQEFTAAMEPTLQAVAKIINEPGMQVLIQNKYKIIEQLKTKDDISVYCIKEQ